jgi:hypothetical protein
MDCSLVRDIFYDVFTHYINIRQFVALVSRNVEFQRLQHFNFIYEERQKK